MRSSSHELERSTDLGCHHRPFLMAFSVMCSDSDNLRQKAEKVTLLSPPAGFNEVFDDVNGTVTVVAQ